MTTWRVDVSRNWTERGVIDVEAASEEDARVAAFSALAAGAENIKWARDNMDLQDADIDDVMLLDAKGKRSIFDDVDK